ncbi:hypothetical protein tb265_28730 [Gemmatimonadetes bacterium T265]|nr:hypothetical protein tb265_28730 [Gemmatimonadetes bacterium T265]
MSDAAPAPLLAGALRGFALGDVLQLLELGARTGTLVVDGGPLGGGAVRLRDGRVVAVQRRPDPDGPRGDHVSAIADLLDVVAGRWAFYAAGDAPAAFVPELAVGGEDASVTRILVEVARRRDERARRAARAPTSVPDVPHLAHDAWRGAERDSAGQLTAADLHVLSMVDGVRDVHAIAAATRRDVAHVCGVLHSLRALGLVGRLSAHVCDGQHVSEGQAA